MLIYLYHIYAAIKIFLINSNLYQQILLIEFLIIFLEIELNKIFLQGLLYKFLINFYFDFKKL